MSMDKETKIHACYQAIQAALPHLKFKPKKTKTCIAYVDVGNDYNSWDAATDILDYHGFERRHNRPIVNEIIQQWTS